MTTEETSKLSLPGKFYKNSLRADNSKILHDQVARRQGINKKKAAKWDFRATVEKKVQEISQILWLLRLFHKFNVLCLLAFSALLHCLSCFNSYPRMMLINVVGSVSVLRASYAVICT